MLEQLPFLLSVAVLEHVASIHKEIGFLLLQFDCRSQHSLLGDQLVHQGDNLFLVAFSSKDLVMQGTEAAALKLVD